MAANGQVAVQDPVDPGLLLLLGGAAAHGATLGLATLRPSKRPNQNPELPKVCRNGFYFNQKKRLKDGRTRSCECESYQTGCRARAYYDIPTNMIVRYGPREHNHGAIPERVDQLNVSLLLYQ